MQTIDVALYDTLADWEPGYAVAGLNMAAFQREPGRFRVRTVARTTEPITTQGGLRILPDATLDQLDPATSALLLLPGADTWTEPDGNAEFAEAAARYLDAGVPVAAICGATFGLARAALLDERAHTSNAPQFLEASGYGGAARYRAEAAVTDRDVITAGATHPVAFAREIFARLDVYTPDVLDAWFGLYTTGEAKYLYALAGDK